MDATAWFHVAVSNTSLASCISNVSANSSAFGATAAATVTTTAPTTLGFFAAWHRPGSDAKEIFGPYSSYVAIGVVVVAAILSGVGGVVQKVAHRNSSGRQYCPRPLTTSACCLMTAGIVITILAAGLDLAALMFGNIALVVPLGSLKLVVIAFLSALCYRQRLEWWDALWVACIIVGCAATVYFSVPRVCIFTLADLEGLYTRPGVIAYASTVGCLIVGVLIFLACVRQIEKRHGTDSPRYRSLQLAQRNAYPVGAGMIGAQGVLFAKALVEIITDYAIRPPGTPAVNSSSQYIWFAMGAGVVFFISMQIFLLNEGLSRFRAVSQLPVFQCTWTLWSVAGGAVFYVEMSMFDVADWIFYPLGVVLVLTGFVMLEVRRSRFKIKRNSVDTTAVRLLEGYGE